MTNASREYPRTVSCNGSTVELSLMSASDVADLKAFVASLSAVESPIAGSK